MRKVLVILVALCVAATAFAQSIDLRDVDLSTIDLDQADLSQMKFYFNGPMELLVRDVYYAGQYWSAVLDYDGAGTFTVKVPSSTSAYGLPMTLDLSDIDVSLTSTGLNVVNVVADGYRFSGALVPTPDLALQIAPPVRILGPVEEEMVAAADTSNVDQLQRTVSQLQRQVNSLERELDQSASAVGAREDEISRLQQRISSLQDQAPGSAMAAQMTAMEMAEEVTRSAKRGFSGGEAVLGDWRATSTRLSQTDGNQLFAKYVIPVRQSANELVYEFSGSASGTGRKGFGLHFLGSASTLSQGYGFGSSYLVWVTRDPGFNQTEQTYIQLYKSFDDVRMVQMASHAIDLPITRSMDVTVYVDRADRTIHIGVNGEEVIALKDSSIYRSGTAVAARTLGAAQFTGLEVRTK